MKKTPPPDPMADPIAAILVIGDEILSGKVVDQNSPYLARTLRALGVDVGRMVVIPDKVERIAEEVAYLRARFAPIFTTGGVGPTHDDVTMEGIAAGVGTSVIRHPALEKRLRERYGDQINAAYLRLADVPDGAELIDAPGLRSPVIRYEQFFIFPGIPEHCVRKFEAIKERFRTTPFHLAKILIDVREEAIADILSQAVATFPSLHLGSYPQSGTPNDQVLLTLESKEIGQVREAEAFLRSRLPQGRIRPFE
jgi:molybdenum cofactor synthesis domain-containing protein